MSDWFLHKDSHTLYREVDFDESEIYDYSKVEVFDVDGFHFKEIIVSKDDVISLEFENDSVKFFCKETSLNSKITDYIGQFKGKPLKKELVIEIFQKIYSQFKGSF